MSSFYGGPPGESFSISKIFRNKKEMIEDLNQGFFSSVKIDDFVFISYGMPGDKDGEYNKNLEIDKKSYNSTLWKKILLDKNDPFDQKNAIEIYEDQNNLIAYILLASLTGNTPQFIKPDGTPGLTFNIINADQEPKAFLDNSEPDTPALIIELPKTWSFTSEQSENLPAGSSPTVELTKVDSNNQKFTFALPNSQRINQQPTIHKNPGETLEGNVLWDEKDINNPKLTFELPNAWDFEQLETETPDAGSLPSVKFTDKLVLNELGEQIPDKKTKTFKFSIPKSQKIKALPTKHSFPGESLEGEMIWDDITDPNNPALQFRLPNAWNFEQLDAIESTAKDNPQVFFEDKIVNGQPDHQTKTFQFKLPKSWQFEQLQTQYDKANIKPTVVFTDKMVQNEEGVLKPDNLTKTFQFTLPEPYTFKLSDEPFLLPPGNIPYINLAPNPNNASELILTLQIPKGQKFNPIVDNSENSAPGTAPIVTIQGTDEEPQFKFVLPRTQKFNTKIVNNNSAPGTLPEVNISNDIDNPQFIFNLPRTQKFNTTVINKTKDAGTAPEVTISEDVDNPQFTFNLPKTQVLNTEIINVIKDANIEPSVEISKDVNSPQLTFNLPRAQTLNTEIVNESSDPGSKPIVSISSDVNSPQLTFNLPKTQVLNTEVITNILDPIENPKVSLSDDINNPQFTFNLPDNAKFHFGDLLGQSAAGEYSENISDTSAYRVGDYYINKATGFIYLITQINKNISVHFKYVACLAGTEPIVDTKSVNPYTDNEGTLNKVSVETSYADPVEKTGAKYIFSIPSSPGIKATYNSIGSEEKGSVTKSITENKDINFNFSIPDGTRWFIGNAVNSRKLDAQIADAQKGDLYLYTVDSFADMDRGNIYRFNGMSWEFTNHNIEGPVGESLRIAGSEFYSGPNSEDTLELISAKLEVKYPSITSSELINVTYTANEGGVTSYWYFKVDNFWNRSQITGGLEGILANDYEIDSTNKVYSVKYTNTLLQNTTQLSPEEKLKKTYNATIIDSIQTNLKKEITILTENISWGKISDIK